MCMKKISLPFLVLMLGLAGCQSASDDVVSQQGFDCAGENCEVIRYASPNGNDLVLETSKHVIEIQAQGGDVPYSYYVWTGNKSTNEDPDLVIEDGNAMVLVED